METGNETASRNCRFLSSGDFDALYATFTAAFSDYVYPFALTAAQFQNHINLNGVDLERTVGCFESERLVGFSLNGFGKWHDVETVYDAGTGVIPEMRRKGVAEAMFDMMMPRFQSEGIAQFLLEVITTNPGAIRLYEKLRFRPVRELALLQRDGEVKAAVSGPKGLTIDEITEPDWLLLQTFWDGEPSWQNSIDSIRRSMKLKRIFGAFVDQRCVGYIVFSSKFGRVSQIAVDKAYRDRGIGTGLLRRLQTETASGYSLQIINVDKSLERVVRFFRSRGFYERLAQHEMVLTL